MRMFNRSVSPFIALCLLVFSSSLIAGPQGRISGTVLDDSGVPVADATVVITGVGSPFDETYTTNKKGRFTATFTDATWDYKVEISKDGYIPSSDVIDVKVGEAIRLTWELVEWVEVELVGDEKAIEIFNIGAAAFNDGDLEAAIVSFREAIFVDSEMVAAYETLAQVLYQAEKYIEASEVAQQWLDRESENVDALNILFDSLVSAKNSEGVLAIVDQVVATGDADTPKRLFNAGAVALASGQQDLSTSLIGKALELQPDFLEAMSTLARLYAADEEFESAEELAQAALALDPQDPGALIVLFDINQRTGDHDAAESYLAVMKEADPLRASDILGEQANEYLNRGRLDIADHLSTEAIKLNPTNPKALFARASLALNNNQIEVAKELFLEVIDAAPSSAQATQAKEILDYL